MAAATSTARSRSPSPISAPAGETHDDHRQAEGIADLEQCLALSLFGAGDLRHPVPGLCAAQYLGDPFGTEWIWFAVLVILTLLFAIVTNLNLVSQHRMYRDRLMEALCPDTKAVEKGVWHPAKIADALQLSVLRAASTAARRKRRIRRSASSGPII
jgi:hypothetical protein